MLQLLEREFKVGMYIRLSREDGDKQESESIGNQRKIIKRYIDEHNLNLIDEYVDDGVSGTTFDRKDFNRLINDIENKKINMVITKDLSRLGRDYIKTGYYIENYFPENQIRYVSILDGIDTYNDTVNNDITPFKAILNDMYAKDISKKIRSVYKEKQKQGEFLGAVAAYGYKRSPIDNHKLIIDDKVADVVRKIFDMYVDGVGAKSIVKYLNEKKYLSPLGYRKTGIVYDENKTTYNWNATTIGDMLKNEVYLGHTIANKVTVVSYKVKKVRKVEEENYIRVENTHEPIIDKNTFDKVQALHKAKAKKVVKKYDYLLRELLYCKHCNRQLQIVIKNNDEKRRRNTPYIIDATYNLRNCFPRNINYINFEQQILASIKQICQIYADRDKLTEKYKKINNKSIDLLSSIKKQVTSLDTKINEINYKLDQVYDDKLNKLLPEADFMRISQKYIKERDEIELKKEVLTDQLQSLQGQQIKKNKNDEERMNKTIDDFLEMKDVDKATLFRLINKIEIDKDKNIFISFNFAPLNTINENIDEFIEIEKIVNENSKKQNVG